MGTEEVKPQDNPQDQEGQVQGNQGQPTPPVSQPAEVELSDGTKVSVEELKKGYLRDGDYRRKTQEVAAQRRQLEAERQMVLQGRRGSQSLLSPEMEPEEEPNPYEILAKEIIGLKTAYARDYLKNEIDKLNRDYPEADKKAVFDACWSNPNAVIEEEMRRSHEIVLDRVNEKVSKVKQPATLDDFLRQHPDEKKKYDERLLADYHAKKLGKQEAATGTVASGSGGQTFSEPEDRPKGYGNISQKLKERLKESTQEPI